MTDNGATLEVNLACGDTITVQTMPKIGSYRFCIHCDARKKVTGTPNPPRTYCTKGHQPGEHDASCMPPAEPNNPELRLLRAIFGLCPLCDETTNHEHTDSEYTSHGMVPWHE